MTIDREEADRIESALAEAIAAANWLVANQCADLLNKLSALATPRGEPASKWLATNATLPVQVHPTEGEGDVVRSDAWRPSGEYL